jgi:hypothetical protein
VAEEVQTKGVGLRSLLESLERLHGEDAVEEAMQLLPREVRDALVYKKVVPSGWYPIAWHRALHAAAQSATGSGPELARMIGRDSSRADFRGVYKFVAQFLSPQMLLRQAARVFGNYFRDATLEIVDSTEKSAHASFRDCFGFDHNMWQNVLGGIETSLEISGARDVGIVVERGGRDGSAFMDVIVRWR